MKRDIQVYAPRFEDVRSFGLEYFPPGKQIPVDVIDMHSHVHFGIVLSGSHRGWCDGDVSTGNTGDAWLTGPFEPHTSYGQTADHEAIVASFQIENLCRGFSGWEVPVMAPFSCDVAERRRLLSAEMNPGLLEMGRELRDLALLPNQDDYAKLEEWLLIHRLFVHVLRNFSGRNAFGGESGMERVMPAFVLPRKQPGRPVSVEEAAAACHLSVPRFGELFKRYAGTTFRQYEIRFRMSGARADIVSRNGSLKEIAARWGFYDTSHFLHAFRRYYGLTPG
ncbi:MAG: AraC family transcriptional regulator, partial [Victivallaceae bacterium]|nr:AraC family transcriptional regulator [Victivallaceae bacterium]